MIDVEKILKKYQEAHLVITSRLHAALPCLALETPVIVIHKEVFDKDRLGSFFEYFENFLEKDILDMEICEMLKEPKTNSDEYVHNRQYVSTVNNGI